MSTLGKTAGAGPQFLHLEDSVAPSCLAGLPGESCWELVSPTVSGARVPGFRCLEKAGPARVLVWKEAPFANYCN